MGEAMLKDWMTRRAKYMYGHPHIRKYLSSSKLSVPQCLIRRAVLALLFTAPSAQRLGAGSMQVQWGTALADQLLVPWYVEGTPAGHKLYAANGAADLEKVRFVAPAGGKEASGEAASDGRGEWVSEYTMMRREPRRVSIEREARAAMKN